MLKSGVVSTRKHVTSQAELAYPAEPLQERGVNEDNFARLQSDSSPHGIVDNFGAWSVGYSAQALSVVPKILPEGDLELPAHRRQGLWQPWVKWKRGHVIYKLLALGATELREFVNTSARRLNSSLSPLAFRMASASSWVYLMVIFL